MSDQIVWDARYKESPDGQLHDLGLYQSVDAARDACLEHAEDYGIVRPDNHESLEWQVLETNHLPPHHIGGWEDLAYMIYPRKVNP